ncbi:MAG: MFS transporter [Candidatus Latescibacterota bacterium]
MSSRRPVLDDRAYRKVVNAWAMYDWGNSAFATTIMAAVFPVFYRELALAAGASANDATAYWAYTTAVALLIVALLGPVLGAVADHTGGKKYYLGFFAGLGIVGTALFTFLGDGTYVRASVFFIIGNVGFAGANIFYESLLPHVAREEDIDRVSTRGYAMGYVGGGILLVVHALWLTHPEWFFMPGSGFAVRAVFLSVAVWWAVFSIPLFRRVSEPAVMLGRGEAVSPVRAGFGRLGHTLRQLLQYRQLLLFLGAFWLYNDGIGTIIKMAAVYGSEIGLDAGDMIGALIITQFIGIPCTFAFGRLAGRMGTKRPIFLGLAVYTLISITGYFMQTATHFYMLAIAVGLVQGGTQALSRSLFASMVPKSQASEFFGFFSTSSKFAGILGPVIFALVNQLTGSSRLSIVAIVVFFVGGSLLLLLVDEEEGMRVAREEDEAFGAAGG